MAATMNTAMQIIELTAVRQGNLGLGSGFFLGSGTASFADTTVYATFATMEKQVLLRVPVPVARRNPCLRPGSCWCALQQANTRVF